MNSLITCGHCGNKTVHEIISITTTNEKIEYQEQEFIDINSIYIITKCRTCNQVSIFSQWDIDDNETKDLEKAVRIYPTKKYLPIDISDKINSSYREAYRLIKISPQAHSIMIRRCLELICKDQNANGKNLHQMLMDLAKRGIIPPILAEMTNLIKEIGNAGTHEDNFSLNKFDSELVNDFFLALVDFIYTIPSKIKKIKNRIGEGGSDYRQPKWPDDFISLN